MQIKYYMTKDVATVKTSDNLHEAGRLMWEKDCGALPVMDDEGVHIVGMVTDRDIAMAAFTRDSRLRDISVKETMSNALFKCQQDDELNVAEGIMQKDKIRRLPVVDNADKLVGIISLNDIAIAYRAGKGKKVKADDIAETLSTICDHRSHEAV